jgi:hypothetical protein
MIQDGQDALEDGGTVGRTNDDGEIDACWQRSRLIVEQHDASNGDLKKNPRLCHQVENYGTGYPAPIVPQYTRVRHPEGPPPPILEGLL